MGFSFQTVSVSCLAEVRRRSSVQDRTLIYNSKSSSVQDRIVIDNTYIESAIFGLFRIDLINYIKVKSILAKEFHIQPSEIDRMPAWEYELFVKEINQAVKEENERNQKEMDKAGIDKAKKMSDPKNYQKSFDNSMKDYSNFGNIGNMKF